jgi:hypothetical protein
MFSHELSKALFEIEELKARLATVEGERDAARAASEKDREWVGRALDKQREYLEQCQALIAERDTAQSGEARAVEALKRIRDGAEVDISDLTNEYEALKLCSYCGGSNDHTDECPHSICVEALAEYDGPLAWLAQQRVEAAAEALERIGGSIGTHWETSLSPDEITDGIRAYLIEEAAALRAGATGGSDD